jgi:sugar (pentulose or hexulose) kinase
MSGLTGPLLLGIDAGTLYIKSVLLDIDGRELAVSGREATLEYSRPGWAEQDMEELWRATAATIKEVITRSGARSEDIAGVCATGQGHGSYLIGKDGKPARKNAISWLDTRKQDILKEWYKGWKHDGIASEIYDVSGWRLMECMQILHMAWLSRNEPATLQKARAHMECKDWLRYKLTGQVYMDYTGASLTGLFNPARLDWEDSLFEEVQVPRELFPEVLGSWERAGEVTYEASLETGLKKGTPVAAGAVDICASGLAAGAITPGICCSIIGTAGIHELCTDRPIYDRSKEYCVCCAAAPDRWYVETGSNTAGACLRWFRDKLGHEEVEAASRTGASPYQLYDGYVEKAPLGSNGVLFHPFFSGERSPIFKPNARGLFFGLGLWTEKQDILRSIYEGVGFSTKDNLRLFEEAGIRPEEIRLVGGGARSNVWAQIIADITGYPIRVPLGEEFGAKGAAIEAGVVARFYQDPFDGVKKTVRVAKEFEPEPIRHKKYSKLFKAYGELYALLWDFYESYSAALEDSLETGHRDE